MTLPLSLETATVRRAGRSVLGPVDLTIEGEGLTAVIGPNGSGKTTLLRALHGIERLSSGRLICDDAQAQSKQAFVFQTPILLRRSVAGNLAYPLRLSRRGGIDAHVRSWAERIGLADRLSLPANRLSGGERQKLALARALITGPALLFLDEPCASLDGQSTQEIETLLSTAAATGTRILLATHDMGQARRLADDVLFLVGGRIHETGPAALANPQTTALRAFLNGDIVT